MGGEGIFKLRPYDDILNYEIIFLRNQTLEDEFKMANVAKLYAYTIRRSTRGHAAVREDGQVFIRYKYYYKGYKWSAWEKTAALPERITEELQRVPTGVNRDSQSAPKERV
jgi:hypothetical protein